MKTILYLITQGEMGGAQEYILSLAQNLKNDYKIVVAFGKPVEKSELAEKLKKFNIEYKVISNLKRNISPISDILAFFEIRKLIKNLKPDIIHLNSSKISILGSLAAFKISNLKFKIIYTVHGWVFNEPLPFFLRSFYKWVEKFTAKYKDKIICVSEFDRQTAIKEKICAEEKLTTVHNGISKIDLYGKDEACDLLHSIFHLPIASNSRQDNNYLIGTLANFYPTKGLTYLIEAAKILIKDNKLPIKFLILGDGKERQKLMDLIDDHKLNDSVFLPGYLADADKYLKAFDIYACSSVKEGFPYSILKAMSAGLPVVSTKVGGIPEIITERVNGSLVPAKDPQVMADKIIELIGDKNLRESIGMNAEKIIKENFSLEKMISDTKKVYDQ